jgi:hypothetical protein
MDLSKYWPAVSEILPLFEETSPQYLQNENNLKEELQTKEKRINVQV